MHHRFSRLAHAFAGLGLLFGPCSAGSANTKQSWTLAASGDLIGNVVHADDPLTQAVWDVTRGADFSFFNMEGQIFDQASFEGYPASENGGDNVYGGVGGGPTYPFSHAALLVDYGFNMASFANNRAWDYGEAGMIATQKNLADAGIAASGVGQTLDEARKAVIVTKDNRRVALVSAAGTHTPQSVAGPGDPEEDLRPRPGISVLRATPVTVVNETGFSLIKDIARSQGQILFGDETEITLYTGQSPLGWSHWRLGTEGESSIALTINPDDYAGILQSIEAVKDQVDTTIFSLHAHESESGTADSYIPLPPASLVPASYIRNISYAAIEAGADVVLIHGPHALRGIEVYKSRPIFYGLGSLTYSLGLSFRGVDLPIEWDDGVIAETIFQEGVPEQIVLHSLVHNQLTNNTSLPDRTMPKMAPSPEAARILNHLQRASEEFGTQILVKDEKGYIKIGGNR